LIKSDSKDIYNVTKDFKQVLFLCTFYASMNFERNVSQFPFKYESSTTVFNVDNNQLKFLCFLIIKSSY